MPVSVVEGKDSKEENGGSFCGGEKFWSEGEEERLSSIKVPASGVPLPY